MRTTMFLALALAAAVGCNRNNQPTMHQARTQTAPAEQSARTDNSVDTENPNNRTLPDDPNDQNNQNNQQQQNQGTQGDQGGSTDVGNPNDPSGSTGGTQDDTQPPTGPDVP
jgi:hypothetical protein